MGGMIGEPVPASLENAMVSFASLEKEKARDRSRAFSLFPVIAVQCSVILATTHNTGWRSV